MFAIFKKEINSFLGSLSGYVVLVVFFVTTGIMCWLIPSTSFLEYGYADMRLFFEIAPYLFLFLIPATCMRLFADEYNNGTIELLLTKPLAYFKIIGGKYLGAWFLVFLALIPTLVYYFSLSAMANPVNNIDTSGIFGSYLGLFLLGGVFCSIGCFTSSLTNNQIIAFVLCFVLCFILYEGFNQIATIGFLSNNLAYIFGFLSIKFHYDALGRGVVDTRNITYLISLILFFLFATRLVLEIKRN